MRGWAPRDRQSRTKLHSSPWRTYENAIPPPSGLMIALLRSTGASARRASHRACPATPHSARCQRLTCSSSRLGVLASDRPLQTQVPVLASAVQGTRSPTSYGGRTQPSEGR